MAGDNGDLMAEINDEQVKQELRKKALGMAWRLVAFGQWVWDDKYNLLERGLEMSGELFWICIFQLGCMIRYLWCLLWGALRFGGLPTVMILIAFWRIPPNCHHGWLRTTSAVSAWTFHHRDWCEGFRQQTAIPKDIPDAAAPLRFVITGYRNVATLQPQFMAIPATISSVYIALVDIQIDLEYREAPFFFQDKIVNRTKVAMNSTLGYSDRVDNFLDHLHSDMSSLLNQAQSLVDAAERVKDVNREKWSWALWVEKQVSGFSDSFYSKTQEGFLVARIIFFLTIAHDSAQGLEPKAEALKDEINSILTQIKYLIMDFKQEQHEFGKRCIPSEASNVIVWLWRNLVWGTPKSNQKECDVRDPGKQLNQLGWIQGQLRLARGVVEQVVNTHQDILSHVRRLGYDSDNSNFLPGNSTEQVRLQDLNLTALAADLRLFMYETKMYSQQEKDSKGSGGESNAMEA